jgi:hypothetical protein
MATATIKQREVIVVTRYTFKKDYLPMGVHAGDIVLVVRNDQNVEYTVTLRRNKIHSCTCKAGQSNTRCYHVNQMAEQENARCKAARRQEQTAVPVVTESPLQSQALQAATAEMDELVARLEEEFGLLSTDCTDNAPALSPDCIESEVSMSEDISATEHIINKQMAVYELKLAGMTLAELVMEMTKYGVECKKNAKQPVREALAKRRRHQLEHEAEVQALEALPERPLTTPERVTPAPLSPEERELLTLNGNRPFSLLK